VAIEDIGTAPSASVGVRYNESAVRESSVGLYERAGSSWQSVPAGTVTLDTATDTATVQIGANGTYGAFADENGSAPSLPLGERLFPNGLPASSTGDPPTDVDGDGTLEDMDGNGRFQFTDVIEFVFSQQRGDYASLTTAQSDALDLDGNGRVTFVDVIDLVFELQAS
jgi:PKD repeat protein